MRDAQLEIGDTVAGKYVVESVLGRGGMGTVYAVVHAGTGKRLALKCLLPAYIDNASVVERFIREAKAVGRIQHRHVIDVFDQGRDGNVLYIVLPLLEGKPLSDLLHDESLTLQEALLILVRAMEGVAAANALGVLHRDLKPTNIFVCVGVSGRLDDPRVLDFGISKFANEPEPTLTRSGVAVGTPHYMSIEQLTGQRDLDERVDVYSMGVILYEAVCGALPHVADNVAALALRLMHYPPVHLSRRRPDLPPRLAEVVMRAIARDREDRYPSMRAMIDAVLPFVPASAGLTVSEPDGPRLRTPRETGEPAVAETMAAAAAMTKPGVRLGTPDLPLALSSQEAAEPSPLRFHRSITSLVVFGALVVGVSLYFARSSDSESERPLSPRPPVLAVQSVSADQTIQIGLQTAPAADEMSSAIAVESRDASTTLRPARARLLRKPFPRAQTAAPVEPTKPPDTNARAGAISADEF